MKHNRQSQQAEPISLIGVAGVVRKQFVEQNSALEDYVDEAAGPEKPVYRREMFDGRPHTVFPAVLAVEGVMNNALVSADELRKSAPAWNGRAIPLLHPEQMGLPISVAEAPEVLERRVGTIFNATFDNKRLKAELWIDDQKMDHLGASDVVSAMLNGEVVEVSTGYFSDDVLEQGEFNGKPYSVRHANLRPDHLALLPGQIGACSIADGCGAPRINSRRRGLGVKAQEALQVIATALGIHTNNCSCEACSMKTTKAQISKSFDELKLHDNEAFLKAVDGMLGKKADAGFHANKGLGAKHLKMLEELDEKGLGMMSAMIEAYRANGGAAVANEDPPAGTEEDDAAMQQKQQQKAKTNQSGDDKPLTITKGELDTLVANAAKQAVKDYASKELPTEARRVDVKAKLKANERNPFSDEELATLPVSTLENVEKSLRVNDYSGQAGFGGGYAPNSEGESEPAHIIANRKLEERRQKRAA